MEVPVYSPRDNPLLLWGKCLLQDRHIYSIGFSVVTVIRI